MLCVVQVWALHVCAAEPTWNAAHAGFNALHVICKRLFFARGFEVVMHLVSCVHAQNRLCSAWRLQHIILRVLGLQAAVSVALLQGLLPQQIGSLSTEPANSH